MITASQARAVGRQMIRENKSLVFGTYFAYLGITIAISLVSGVLSSNPFLSMLWGIGSIFVSMPLILGLLHVNNMVYYKRPCSVGNLFDFFRNYHVTIKVIGVSYVFLFVLMILLIPIMLAVMLPIIGSSAIMGNLQYSYSFSQIGNMGAFGAGLVLGILVGVLVGALIGMLLSSIMMANYYVALRNRSISFGNLLGSSLKIGFKYLWKYFVFQLTFLGWMLLAMVPMLVSLIVSMPMLFSYSAAGSITALAVIIVGALLTIVAASFVEAYIYTSSAAFFNTAIDEYEQQHPDYSGYAPYIPQPPVEGFRVEEPQQMPPPQEPEEPVEHVEAEQIGIPPETAGTHEVRVISGGFAELSVARVITELTRMDITDAMAFLSQTPKTLCADLSLEEARRVAKLLTDAGARVEIQ